MVDKLVSIFKLFGENLLGFDIIVVAAALITLAYFSGIKHDYKVIKDKRNKYQDDPDSSEWLQGRLAFAKDCRRKYTIFRALISIFPLLGMLGTVLGLLGLDMSSGDMENIKSNFFMALTSTAWGIICSVGFKIADARNLDAIEYEISAAERFIENDNRD